MKTTTHDKKYTTNSKIVKEQHIKRERRKNDPERKLHDTCTSHQTVYASKKKKKETVAQLQKVCSTRCRK